MDAKHRSNIKITLRLWQLGLLICFGASMSMYEHSQVSSSVMEWSLAHLGSYIAASVFLVGLAIISVLGKVIDAIDTLAASSSEPAPASSRPRSPAP